MADPSNDCRVHLILLLAGGGNLGRLPIERKVHTNSRCQFTIGFKVSLGEDLHGRGEFRPAPFSPCVRWIREGPLLVQFIPGVLVQRQTSKADQFLGVQCDRIIHADSESILGIKVLPPSLHMTNEPSIVHKVIGQPGTIFLIVLTCGFRLIDNGRVLVEIFGGLDIAFGKEIFERINQALLAMMVIEFRYETFGRIAHGKDNFGIRHEFLDFGGHEMRGKVRWTLVNGDAANAIRFGESLKEFVVQVFVFQVPRGTLPQKDSLVISVQSHPLFDVLDSFPVTWLDLAQVEFHTWMFLDERTHFVPVEKKKKNEK